MQLTGAQTEHCKNIRRYHFRFHSSSKCLLLELHLFCFTLQRRHKHVYTSTKDPILTTDDHRLDLLVTQRSLHRVNNAQPHCCAVK